MRTFCLGFVGLCLILSGSHCCQAGNSVFETLVNQGVTLSGDEALRLPPPTLPDGLSADAQRAAIEAIPDNRHSWEALARKSSVAPFVFKTAQGEMKDNRILRRLDVWFVVYGDLQTLTNEEFVDGQFKMTTGGGAIRKLSDADLRQRGLPVPKNPEDAHYVSATFPILGLVQITATSRETKTRKKDSVLAASMIDPHFNSDKEFPNTWRSLRRDEAGHAQLGPPEPYSGFGSYVKATRLIEPAGAVLVEYHLVFAEPIGWFNGANLLGSKLSLVAQSVIRGARRAVEAKPGARP